MQEITLKVVSKSSNSNSLGLTGHILVSPWGSAYEIALNQLNSLEQDQEVTVWADPFGEPNLSELNGELVRRLSPPPKEVLDEIWGSRAVHNVERVTRYLVLPTTHKAGGREWKQNLLLLVLPWENKSEGINAMLKAQWDDTSYWNEHSEHFQTEDNEICWYLSSAPVEVTKEEFLVLERFLDN